MTEQNLIKILLVRAVEETAPRFYSLAQMEEAESRAGDVAEAARWVRRRASFLFSLLPGGLRDATSIARLPLKRLLLIGIPVFLAGVFANFLGPASTFHVLYNPMTALVLWNLLVLFIFIAAGIASVRRSAMRTDRKVHARSEDGGGANADPSGIRADMPFSHRVMVSLWMRVGRYSGSPHDAGESGLPVSDVLKRFGHYYTGHCGELSSSRLRLLFHVSALALIAGAVAGMYVRGVFFEYSVVWRSTFINDPEIIRLLLNIAMGIPSHLLTGSLITPAQVNGLMSPSGAPAAQWIHLLTFTALLCAVLPRTVLLCVESVRLRARALFVRPDMADAYYQEITRKAWDMKADALRSEIDRILSHETSRFSAAVALYVREQLYDRAIVPALTRFRSEGGRIADLEGRIRTSCREFEKPLERYIGSLQEDFKSSLSAQIETLAGRQPIATEIAMNHGRVYNSAEEASRSRGEALTDTFAGMIHVTITTVITGTIATVSGGLGKSIGVAVVSVLLHTTGPVGLLIGALIGLMVAGGVSWAAKDRINDAVKDYPLPAIMMRTLFSDEKLREKIEEGRQQIYMQVEEETGRQMNATAERLRESLLAGLMDVLRSGRPA